MADISHIFGGSFTPPEERRIAPPEEQLKQSIADAGMIPPEVVYLDGNLHRFNPSGKRGTDKPAWYIAFGDNVPAGRYGCWRSGVEHAWTADVGRKLTATESMAHTRRMTEARAARDAEREKSRDLAANTVSEIWGNAQAASPEHPYLARKKVKPNGARITGDGRLMIPLYSPDGDIRSLQYISHDGTKMMHTGGQSGGCFWRIGSPAGDGAIYVAEGFATAASIHEVTGRPCIVAFSASNLPAVTGSLREQFGAGADICIVADNDESGTGVKFAEKACAEHGARYVMPPNVGTDANDYLLAGGDLLTLLEPEQIHWLLQADDFSSQPAPIRWIVKGWIQENSLMMLHGPSGSGKTFALLDMLLRVAGGIDEWMGAKVKAGNVVYLAGEGHHGLKGRIAGWKHRNKVNRLNMWVSKDGCDLNTPDGLRKVITAIRQIPADQRPSVIAVDTLHRFLNGDENSAQDAKTMLDACDVLMREFDCTVILVHHTGVSDEAQHRARGSSAWKGALDVEINVMPAKADGPMTIRQMKSKDAELALDIYATLESIEIPGWFDEDGEPVTTAVLVQSDAPVKNEKESKHSKHIKMLESAWWDSGAEIRDGKPYLTRSGLINYLIDKLNLKESTAETYAKPSSQGRLVCDLLMGGVIETFEHGWMVVDNVMASAWAIRKNGITV